MCILNKRGWRPDNWKGIDTWLWMPNGHHVIQPVANALFEEGASAMFIALMKEMRTAPGMDTFHYRKLCEKLGYKGE